MKAIILDSSGGPEQLREMDLPVPTIGAKEVLIQVKAISINPVDVKTRSGKGIYARLKDIEPIVLGWDISGIIMETEAGVTGFKTGDEVFGMIHFPGHGKAYAEYVAAPADQLALKPGNISHGEAAGATLAALTAYQAMVHRARVKQGDKVLVHAAAGGVGHFAVQLAKFLGAYVIGTSSAANRDFVLSLGADEHIDYRAQPFEAVAKEVDFVLDTIGGEYIDRSLEVITQGGTIISIPSGLNETVTEKARAKNVNGYTLLVKPDGRDMQAIALLLEKGAIRSIVSRTFPFNRMPEAHLQIESGRTIGKVVVEV